MTNATVGEQAIVIQSEVARSGFHPGLGKDTCHRVRSKVVDKGTDTNVGVQP